MCDNPGNFVLMGVGHDRVIDSTGMDGLPGRQGVIMPGYYARTTGAVWNTCDKQAQIMAASRTEQLAKVGAPPSTNGS
jgi:hypothetical protein